MKIIVTGGCGFIGHHFVEHLIKNTDWEIIVFDKLSYASNGFNRLRDINCFDDKRIRIFCVDLEQGISEGVIQEVGEVDFIVHMAAETHVDRSITDALPFIKSNVLGTYQILEFARKQKGLKQFVYFSTDEIFGPAPEGVFYKEWDRYNSANPYAATKAGGEELCLAYSNTHGIPLLITHTMNVIGERQFPEKFVPMCINKILNGETITIHADPKKEKSGSRCWIHARNVADALLFLLNNHQVKRDKFNIAGEERSNLEIAQFIAEVLGKPLKYELVDFHSSRPGHDLRYALDGGKMRSLGWDTPKTLEESLEKTVLWTLEHG